MTDWPRRTSGTWAVVTVVVTVVTPLPTSTTGVSDADDLVALGEVDLEHPAGVRRPQRRQPSCRPRLAESCVGGVDVGLVLRQSRGGDGATARATVAVGAGRSVTPSQVDAAGAPWDWLARWPWSWSAGPGGLGLAGLDHVGRPPWSGCSVSEARAPASWSCFAATVSWASCTAASAAVHSGERPRRRPPRPSRSSPAARRLSPGAVQRRLRGRDRLGGRRLGGGHGLLSAGQLRECLLQGGVGLRTGWRELRRCRRPRGFCVALASSRRRVAAAGDRRRPARPRRRRAAPSPWPGSPRRR